jgi:hypothetical protein
MGSFCKSELYLTDNSTQQRGSIAPHSQSVSHYHTPSRELMAHTLTLLTRVRVRQLVSLDQEILVEGDVFNLLRTCAAS